jgi:hypothetical protein
MYRGMTGQGDLIAALSDTGPAYNIYTGIVRLATG